MSDNLPAPFTPGASPFDAIMHADPDGTQWWSARELMPYLGYARWDAMFKAVERARASCRNAGQDDASIFLYEENNSKSAGRNKLEVRMQRLGCYLVAMNGEPSKPEIAAAQRYFATMTRAAELGVIPLPAAISTPVIRPWSERITATVVPHICYMNVNYPGCFTVLTTLSTSLLFLEDELIRHLLEPSDADRPDVSIGMCWANERRAKDLPEVTRRAPLTLPTTGREVWLAVYDNIERGPCETWFHRVYLPEKLPGYLGNKKEFNRHGDLPPASAADNTCRRLAGRSAVLKTKVRKQLAAVGGFAPVGTAVPSIESAQPSLFDLIH